MSPAVIINALFDNNRFKFISFLAYQAYQDRFPAGGLNHRHSRIPLMRRQEYNKIIMTDYSISIILLQDK